ncbi:MAG: MBL fold metallo-hydrolase [Spirochaetales bacterium]
MRIVTLIENTQGAHKGLKTEHGLSFFIEYKNRYLLFDTGASGAFLQNAAKLQLPLEKVEYVFLSHGHYDHSGGIRNFVEAGYKVPLCLGKGFFTPKYAFEKGVYEYVGNDFDPSYLEKHKIPYREMLSPIEEILPDVYVITQFVRKHKDEKQNPRFTLYRQGKFEQDLFEDEILLVLDTPKGLIVLLGCSHPGFKNMVDTVRQRLQKPVYALLGGTHLVEASSQALDLSFSYLQKGEIQQVGCCHCTGEKALNLFSNKLANFFPNKTGSMFYLEE